MGTWICSGEQMEIQAKRVRGLESERDRLAEALRRTVRKLEAGKVIAAEEIARAALDPVKDTSA